MLLHQVKLPHFKHSAESETVKLPMPDKVVISMAQHLGAPCTPTVKVGDKVKIGDVIGSSEAAMSAPVHSSISGTVTAITDVLHISGRNMQSVVIENDGLEQISDSVCPPTVENREQFLQAVRNSGSIGLGGAGFPTSLKLGFDPKEKQPDFLIINGAECEPYITSDYRCFMEEGEDVLEGVLLMLKYLGIPKCVIGIENNKPECIDLLCQKTKDKPAIEVKPLPSVYGTGAELILIEKCLGREVPHGGLPAAAGAIVMNVTSVSSLGKYLATGMPVVSRVITVDGDACEKPQNLIVPVGTSYEDVLNTAGLKGGVTLGKVVAGGAMMGPAVRDLSYPTTKTTSGLIMLSEATAQPPQVNPCIRCGRCVEYCPMGLEPVEVNQAYAARDVQELGKLHVDYCFNCGSCTFVCPAKRPCTQMMGLAKAFYLGEIKKGGNK